MTVLLGVFLPGAALAGTAAAAVTAVPVRPDRDQARSWAAEELARREYREGEPGLVARALNWLAEQLSAIETPNVAGARVWLIVLAALLLIAVGVALRYAGSPLYRSSSGRAKDGVFTMQVRTAADHREAADRAAQSGVWTTAVLERFRCIVRELEERAVLGPQPGRTADEAAREAGTWLPELAGELAAAATLFDDVRYGDRAASESSDRELRALDRRVRAARPAPTPLPAATGPVTPT